MPLKKYHVTLIFISRRSEKMIKTDIIKRSRR